MGPDPGAGEPWPVAENTGPPKFELFALKLLTFWPLFCCGSGPGPGVPFQFAVGSSRVEGRLSGGPVFTPRLLNPVVWSATCKDD